MSFISILYVLLWSVIGLGLLGVGLTVVRKAHPTAGFVLAAAGLLAILGTCCATGVGIANDPYDRTIGMVTTVVTWGRVLALAVLAATSFAMLAGKLKERAPKN